MLYDACNLIQRFQNNSCFCYVLEKIILTLFSLLLKKKLLFQKYVEGGKVGVVKQCKSYDYISSLTVMFSLLFLKNQKLEKCSISVRKLIGISEVILQVILAIYKIFFPIMVYVYYNCKWMQERGEKFKIALLKYNLNLI